MAEDVKYYDLRAPAPRTVYVPAAQETRGLRILFAVRTTGDAAAIAPAVRAAINDIAPAIDMRVRSVSEAASLALGREQSSAWLAVSFGVLAVLLAAIGLYGVMAFHVSARSREIGVRMALGANTGAVVQLVLHQSLLVIAAGVISGVQLAMAAARARSAR